jgi:hypothetical protein
MILHSHISFHVNDCMAALHRQLEELLNDTQINLRDVKSATVQRKEREIIKPLNI